MVYFLIVFSLIILILIAWEYINAKNKTEYLVKTFFSTLLLVVLLFLFGPFFILSPIKPGYGTLEENEITIYYPAGRIDLGRQVMKTAQEAAYANDVFFQKKTMPKILVAQSDFDMLRFGANPKSAGAGLPWGINVKASSANYSTLAHEMVHKTLQEVTEKSALSLPRWFDEGLAAYLGKMDNYQTLEQLKTAIYERRYQYDLINWQGLDGLLRWQNIVFFDPNRTPRLVYGEAYQMVKYLAEKYSKEKVYQIILATKLISFDQAFNQVLGFSVSQFQDEFVNYVNKQ